MAAKFRGWGFFAVRGLNKLSQHLVSKLGEELLHTTLWYSTVVLLVLTLNTTNLPTYFSSNKNVVSERPLSLNLYMEPKNCGLSFVTNFIGTHTAAAARCRGVTSSLDDELARVERCRRLGVIQRRARAFGTTAW